MVTRVEPKSPTLLAIEEAIRQTGGQIPFSTFMDLSLFGPDGYYSKAKVRLGKEGDFLTSAEASPLFGATIGKRLGHTWRSMGRPKRFSIVEVGAGSGALAEDLLTYTSRRFPAFHRAIAYTIVEYGDLIKRQKSNLGPLRREGIARNLSWVRGSAYEFPLSEIEGAIISNEVPDAFPVDVVKRNEWGEVQQLFVGLGSDGVLEPQWGGATTEVLDYIGKFQIRLQDEIEEPINLNAVRFQQQVDRALRRGIILTIDYGNPREVGVHGLSPIRTFGPGVSSNQYGPGCNTRAYTHPGQVDITASVNFAPLERTAIDDGLEVAFSGSQKKFLEHSGIEKVQIRSVRVPSRQRAEMDAYIRASHDLGGYHALMLTKGLKVVPKSL